MGTGGSKEESKPVNKTSGNSKPQPNVSEKKTVEKPVVSSDITRTSVETKDYSGKSEERNGNSLTVINNNSNSKFNSNTLKNDFKGDLDLGLGTEWKEPDKLRTAGTVHTNNRESELNAYNLQKNQNFTSKNSHYYPETYAERNLRAQYTKNEQMIRQKTIYRDPEEWDVSDKESESSFDVSKFQAANKAAQQQKRDIFNMSPEYTQRYNVRSNRDADDLYQRPHYQKQKSVPKYDISEEELMADIEKDILY